MAGAGIGDPNALVAALVELDRHLGRNGWDTPPRLFALVLSDVLADAEPRLSAELAAGAGVQGGRPPSGELRTTATGAAPGALTTGPGTGTAWPGWPRSPTSFSERRIWFPAWRPHWRIRCTERLELSRARGLDDRRKRPARLACWSDDYRKC